MFAGIVEVMFGGGLPARHLFEGNSGYVKKNRDLIGFYCLTIVECFLSGKFFYNVYDIQADTVFGLHRLCRFGYGPVI